MGNLNRLVRIGVSIAIGFGTSATLRGSTQLPELTNKIIDARIGLVDMQLRPDQDIPQSAKQLCKNDRDANPTVANPAKFTRKCVNGDGAPNHFDVDGWGTIQ